MARILDAAVTQRAMAEVNHVIEEAEPARGDAAEALRRVLAAAWRTLGRYHALIEINARRPHAEVHAGTTPCWPPSTL